MKLTWCHNRLAIGSVPDANADLSVWAEEGVTHVINCRRCPDYQKTLEVLRGIVFGGTSLNDVARYRKIKLLKEQYAEAESDYRWSFAIMLLGVAGALVGCFSFVCIVWKTVAY